MLENVPVLKEVAQIPGLLKEVYGDLAKPGVSQVGKALSTVLGLGNTILWPLALLNEKAKMALDKNLENYRQQLESTPEDKIIEVAPEIGVPIAEKISYVTDEELSNLYINLLAKASTSDTSMSAHPSFVTIINNLCPDEALLLKEMRNNSGHPYLTARLVEISNGQWRLVGDLLTGLEDKVKLSFPNNTVAYLSNFEGLGLIQIRRDLTIAKEELYKDLESKYRPSCEEIQFNRETQRIDFTRGNIEITPFGKLFFKACLTRL